MTGAARSTDGCFLYSVRIVSCWDAGTLMTLVRICDKSRTVCPPPVRTAASRSLLDDDALNVTRISDVGPLMGAAVVAVLVAVGAVVAVAAAVLVAVLVDVVVVDGDLPAAAEPVGVPIAVAVGLAVAVAVGAVVAVAVGVAAAVLVAVAVAACLFEPEVDVAVPE